MEPVTVKPYKHLFSLKTPNGDLSREGIYELNDYLYGSLNLGNLPEDFEFTWSTRRGTLPKRVQSYYYKRDGRKLDAGAISELGNIAKRHSGTSQTFLLDFTDNIDWNQGDFGDGGSCFWSERTGAKTMIEEHGCAIRAYRNRSGRWNGELTNYSGLMGYARAWVAPISESRLIVFNGYGETTLQFARLLALKFNCSYKRIGLTNNKYEDGVLYINSGGMLVGDLKDIEPVTTWELGWADRQGHDSDGDDEDTAECYNCGDRHNCDDMHYIQITVCREDYICYNCSFECARCNGITYAGRVRHNNGERYCLSCYEITLHEEAQAKAEQDKIAAEGRLL